VSARKQVRRKRERGERRRRRGGAGGAEGTKRGVRDSVRWNMQHTHWNIVHWTEMWRNRLFGYWEKMSVNGKESSHVIKTELSRSRPRPKTNDSNC